MQDIEYYREMFKDIKGLNLKSVNYNEETGNIQFNFESFRYSSSRQVNEPISSSVTLPINDLESINGISSFIVGDAGHKDVGVTYADYALNNKINNVYVEYGHPEFENEIQDSMHDVLKVIKEEYNIDYKNMTSMGASAGAIKIGDFANKCSDLIDNKTVAISIDAGDNASNLTKRLVNSDGSRTDELQSMIDNNVVLFAYEASEFGNPEDAANNFKKISEAGGTVVLVKNKNAKDHMDPFVIGLFSGEFDNISNNLEGIEEQKKDGYITNTSYGNKKIGFEQYASDNEYYVYNDNEWLNIPENKIKDFVNYPRDFIYPKYFNLSVPSNYSIASGNKRDALGYHVSTEYEPTLEKIDAVNNTMANSQVATGNVRKMSFSETTSSFPSSINDCNSLLFNSSGQLMNSCARQMDSLVVLLRNYSYIDSELSIKAQELSSGIDVQTKSNNLVPLASNNHTYFINGKEVTSFEPIKQGCAGKISASEISKYYSNGSLQGDLKASIDNQMSDFNHLRESIDDLISSNNTKGPGWDTAMNYVSRYRDLAIVGSELTKELEYAYKRSYQLIDEYLAGDDLDDSEIPMYEQTIQELTQDIINMNNKIQTLHDRIVKLSQIRPKVKKNENGEEYLDWSEYNAAQAKIAELYDKISTLQEKIHIAEEAKKEAEIFLERLKGLAAVVNEANSIVEEAMMKFDRNFTSVVNSLEPIEVEVLNDSTIHDSSRFNEVTI